ncbi:site-2 protease family protein [Rhabdothermincola sp.]|uniref:site-2 protease family protein n=1 Tax=Rhabdothermincola sp. TaxID=2820405 RepID=UPI002FE21DF0
MQSGLDFAVAGIPVRVLPTFFLVSILLGLGYGDALLVGLWVAVVFASILIHELGHAAVYRWFGSDAAIVLHSFGGLTLGRSLSLGRDLVVSLAGPAASLLVGVPLLGLAASGTVTGQTGEAVLMMAIWVNVGWALINLLPILPLDGGQALVSLLSMITKRDATRLVHAVSVVVAGIAVYLAVQAGLLYAAVLAGLFLLINVHALSQRQPWRPAHPATPAQTDPRDLAPAQADPSDRAPAGGHLADPRPLASPAPVAPPVPVAPPAEPAGRGSGAETSPPSAAPISRQPMVGRRSLDDEVASAIKAVVGNEPELALIAIARVRAHGLTTEQAVRANELEAWAWMQRGDLASAVPFIEAVPVGDPARALLEAGRAGLAGQGWDEARRLADPRGEGAALSARFLSTLLPADGPGEPTE